MFPIWVFVELSSQQDPKRNNLDDVAPAPVDSLKLKITR